MLIACGLSHKTAPLEIREKVVFSHTQLPSALNSLVAQEITQEAVILSTCNRTEIYCEMPQVSDQLIQWLANYHGLTAANVNHYCYTYIQDQAVQHIFGVAGGIESMIVGEPQILGQFKQAVSIAEQAGTLSQELRRLFQHAFTVGKKIRHHTDVGAHPVTLGYLVIYLAKRIFSHLRQCRVLLIGAGETMTAVARHLHGYNVKQLTIISRTFSKAQQLAWSLNAHAYSLEKLPEQLAYADIVVTAMQSDMPFVGKGMVESALKARKHRPILMVDLAVPRNIETEINQLSDIYLYSLDMLQTIIDENRLQRLHAIKDAQAIIETQTQHFLAEMRVRQAKRTITAYRQRAKNIRNEMLDKALHALTIGEDPKIVMEKFAHQLTNKLLHKPCVNLRQAAYEGKWEVFEQAEKLLDVDSNL